MRLCVLRASGGNTFMNELLDAVGGAARELGADVIDAVDAAPADDGPGTAYLLVPHEYFATTSQGTWPTAGQRRRTIAFCTEHPGTPWYELSSSLARGLGAAVDINRSAAGESSRRGVHAEHFQLGYVPGWDRWKGDGTTGRPVDVLYLGSWDDRRARLLSGYSGVLGRLRCQVLIAPLRPGGHAHYLTGERKWERMRASSVLINLHRAGTRAIEWPRVLECICNGCVVVSEHSDDPEPLVPGVHLVSGRAESLGHLADHLLRSPDRLAAIRDQAYAFVRHELPLRPSVERLLAMADGLVGRLGRIRTYALRSRDEPPAPVHPTVTAAAPAHPTGEELLRRAVKHLAVETLQLRRQVESLAHRLEPASAGGPAVVAASAAYDLLAPRVTVAIPLYNHRREVVEALTSVLAGDFPDLEIVVVDDASTDGSGAAAQAVVDEHPWIPALLVRHPANRGLGATRNTCVAHARGEYVLMLDADNRVSPTMVSRLVELLDGDPGASFAYPMLAQQESGGPAGILSQYPWDPDLLRDGNYIDAMALIRRDHLVELGGYSEDPRLLGWEDYDLWCRLAEAGRYGVHLPEMLGWYRKNDHSMVSVTNIDHRVAHSLIQARAPGLMAGMRAEDSQHACNAENPNGHSQRRDPQGRPAGAG